MPTNPFVTSTAVRTQQLFFGRQDEIKQLYAAISATPAKSCAVVGLRRSGKSSLLAALSRPEIQQQYLAAPGAFLFVSVDISTARLDAPSDLYALLLRRTAQALGQEIEPGELLDGEEFRAALAELYGQRQLVLLLDEFDTLIGLACCEAAVLKTLRAMIEAGVALVVTAGDTPERLLRRNKKTTAELWKLFGTTIYPRLLTRDEAHQLIEQPMSEAGITLLPAATDMVIDLVGGHPFFLQLAGKELFDELGSGITLDAAGQAQYGARLADACRPYFEGFWRELSSDEQAVLAALISGAGLPPRSLASAERLVNLNLLVRDADDYVPFSTLFGEFAKATLVGKLPAAVAPPPEPPSCVISIICDSYTRSVVVRLRGAASSVIECYEPLDRNLGNFAVLGRNAATSDAWREQIKITGQQLYGLFIKHPEISEALRVGRDIAGDSRLTLRFMGPRDFVGLPFELMYDEDRALALDHPLSRMVTGQICKRDPLGPAVFARARAGDGACTALVISANVSGQLVFKGQRYGFPPVPDVEQEGLKVKETLEEYGWKVTLLSGADVTIASITKALDGCPHHLVHYSGHGFYTPLDPDRSGLVLRDAGGDVAVLEALRLRQLLKTAQTRFVFLSCCSGAASGDSAQLIGSDYLGVIDAIIAAGVPAALGYRWPVDAAGARMLAETFYDKLQQRESLEAALLFARQEIRAQMNDATWAAPILVVQE